MGSCALSTLASTINSLKCNELAWIGILDHCKCALYYPNPKSKTCPVDKHKPRTSIILSSENQRLESKLQARFGIDWSLRILWRVSSPRHQRPPLSRWKFSPSIWL